MFVPSAHAVVGNTLVKLGGCCLMAGVLLAGLMFPIVGGTGLLSNEAGDTVGSVSSVLAHGQVPQMSTMLDSAGNPIAYLYAPSGDAPWCPATRSPSP